MTAHLAHVRWATGDWSEAEPLARLALADGGDGITTRITALIVLGYLASAEVRDAAYLFPFVITGVRAQLADGDVAAAREWLDRCRHVVLLRNIPGTIGAIGHAEGLMHLHDSQTGKARESLEVAGRWWDEHGRFWEGGFALLDQSRCAARPRRPAQADELARRARDRATTAGADALQGAAGQLLGGRSGEDPLSPPTGREAEIARLVAIGATNRDIKQKLFITPKTVAAHTEHILAKLGAARRSQIASWIAGVSR